MADLAISTATDVLSIAIATEGAIAGETLHITRRHAEEITPALRRLSDGFEFELDAIENLYIDIGPGRFTGLRVGIATAIGIGIGSQTKIATLSSLDILRHSLVASHTHGPGTNEDSLVDFTGEGLDQAAVLCLIDARRGEFFGQWFAGLEPIGNIEILSPEVVAEQIKQRAQVLGSRTQRPLLIGDGADLFASEHFLDQDFGDGVLHLPGIRVRAEVMFGMTEQARASSADTLEPLYLRDPDAVIGFKTKNNEMNQSLDQS